MFKLVLTVPEIDDFEIVLYTTNTMEEMDKYTTEHFNEKKDLLKKYENKVQDIIDYCDKTNKEIFISITDIDNKKFQKQVLYKKHKRVFKQIVKNQKFMIHAIKNSRSSQKLENVFSEYCIIEIDRLEHTNRLNKTYVGEIISRWNRQLKEGTRYHSVIRKILSYYKHNYEKLGFSSIDEVYKQYMDEKRQVEEDRNKKNHPEYDTMIQREKEYECIPKNHDDEPEFIPYTEEYNNYLKYLESLPDDFYPHDYNEEEKEDDSDYGKIFTGRRKL